MCRTASLSSCQTVTLESFQVSHKSFQVSHGSGLQNSSRATFADESRLAFFGLPIHQRECWRPPPPPNSTAQMEMSQLSLFVDEPTDEETKQALESLKLDDQQMDEDKDTDRTEEDTEEDTEEEEATSHPPRPFSHGTSPCLPTYHHQMSISQRGKSRTNPLFVATCPLHPFPPQNPIRNDCEWDFCRLDLHKQEDGSAGGVFELFTRRALTLAHFLHMQRLFSALMSRFPFFPCDHTRICVTSPASPTTRRRGPRARVAPAVVAH